MPTLTTLNASACPALQQRGVFLRIADAPTATNGNAPCAPNMTVGNGSNFRYDTVRPIATTIDKVASAGGSNTACIVGSSNLGSELQLVAPGSGLILTVRAGDAIIGGYCEIPNDRTLAVPDATARIWIWLQQDKTLTYTITTTPPTTLSVLLGSCVTSAGNITAVDRSGVLYLRGGALVRYTADPGVPTDSPPPNVKFCAITAFCSFEWDGAVYRQAYTPSVTADPTSVQEGLEWFRSDSLQICIYTGASVQRYSVAAGGGSGVAASTVAEVAAAAVVGTSTNFAREDHRHRGIHQITGTSAVFGDIVFTGAAVSQTGNTFTFTGTGGTGTPASTVTDVAAATAVGTATNYAREDHAHRGVRSCNSLFGDVVLAAGTNVTLTPVGNTITITAASGAALTPAASVTEIAAATIVGTSVSYARQDHVHRGVHAINALFGDITFSAGANVTLTPSGNNIAIAASAGAGTPAATVTSVAAVAVVGTSTNYAREDHVHQGVHKVTGTSDTFGDLILTGAGVTQSGNTFTFAGPAGTPASTVTTVNATSAVGTATNYAREDHQHQGVHGLNGLFGDITLAAGANVTLTPVGNVVTVATTAGAAIPSTVLTISPGAAPIGWVPPAALTEFNALTIYRAQADLTNATQARLILLNLNIATVLTPTIAAQYSVNGGSTWAYIDGASGPTLTYGPNMVNSGWVTLAAGAKADVLLRVIVTGGDGTTSFQFGSIYLQAK